MQLAIALRVSPTAGIDMELVLEAERNVAAGSLPQARGNGADGARGAPRSSQACEERVN